MSLLRSGSIDELWVKDFVEKLLEHNTSSLYLVENLCSELIKLFPSIKNSLIEKLINRIQYLHSNEWSDNNAWHSLHNLIKIFQQLVKENFIDLFLIKKHQLVKLLLSASDIFIPVVLCEQIINLLTMIAKKDLFDKSQIVTQFRLPFCDYMADDCREKNDCGTSNLLNCLLEKSLLTKFELSEIIITGMYDVDRSCYSFMQWLAIWGIRDGSENIEHDFIDKFVINDTLFLEKAIHFFPSELDLSHYEKVDFIKNFTLFFEKLANKGYINLPLISKLQLVQKLILLFNQSFNYPQPYENDIEKKYIKRIQGYIASLFTTLLRRDLIEESLIKELKEMFIKVALNGLTLDNKTCLLKTYVLFFQELVIKGHLEKSFIKQSSLIQKVLSIAKASQSKSGTDELQEAIISFFNALLNKNLVGISFLIPVRGIVMECTVMQRFLF